MRTLIRIFRLVAMVAWILVLLPFQIVAMLLSARAARKIPVLFHRGIARVLGLQIELRGQVAQTEPILFVANHSSWLDIVVLSAVAPVSFVAKSEIAGWPGIGILAKLQSSVFVGRERTDARSGLEAMRANLARGANLVLFAEGTRGDGNRVAPFKSALFSAAEAANDDGANPQVQPVSIAYTHLDGFPLGRRGRPQMTWFGKMELGKHFWAMLGHGPAQVIVEVSPPVLLQDFGSRKELAAHCHREVAASHGHALSGRAASLTKIEPATDQVAAQRP